jgi:hypothetical protein
VELLDQVYGLDVNWRVCQVKDSTFYNARIETKPKLLLVRYVKLFTYTHPTNNSLQKKKVLTSQRNKYGRENCGDSWV